MPATRICALSPARRTCSRNASARSETRRKRMDNACTADTAARCVSSFSMVCPRRPGCAAGGRVRVAWGVVIGMAMGIRPRGSLNAAMVTRAHFPDSYRRGAFGRTTDRRPEVSRIARRHAGPGEAGGRSRAVTLSRGGGSCAARRRGGTSPGRRDAAVRGRIRRRIRAEAPSRARRPRWRAAPEGFPAPLSAAPKTRLGGTPELIHATDAPAICRLGSTGTYLAVTLRNAVNPATPS